MPTEESSFKIWQLLSSFAYLWTTRDSAGNKLDLVIILRITMANESIVLKTIKPSRKVFLYKSIQVFDKCFLAGSSKLDENDSEILYLCEVDSGEEHFIPNITSTSGYKLRHINSCFGQMAFRKRGPDMKSCITKLPNIFGSSLKHYSRLACLKNFHENYLKQKLPKCLQRYCGII